MQKMIDTEKWKRASVQSEKSINHLEAPVEGLRRQKSTPSPGSEKIQSTGDAVDMKPKSYTIERDTYNRLDFSKFDKDECKRMKSPWGRVKTIIERRRDSLKRRSIRREHTCSECSEGKKTDTNDSPHLKSDQEEAEYEGRRTETNKHKPGPIIIEQEGDSGPRTPGCSPTFHRKSRWMRVKKALTGKREDESPSVSTPTSPNHAQDGNFAFDAIEEISQDSGDEGREITRVGSDSHVHRMGLSAPACDLMIQIQRNLSEDFHRKILEWERMRASGTTSCSPHWERKSSDSGRGRKKSDRDDKSVKSKLKDLTWLEKELQKIEKEKQRLSKERQKYEERALRLEKLKETVLSANSSGKREVLVRTSAGEFRFEGISDAFTKKLYEWETKRGLGPELSTLALLDSSRQFGIGPKSLQRVVSRSESSIAGQPSHNSSNSLPSLKLGDPLDRQNNLSRANSEPDLSTLEALANGKNVQRNNSVKRMGEFIKGETEASKASADDEPEKKRKDSEPCYGLLEENMILLEQLRDKEEICRRLETELEVLDKKVDFMNVHHIQETERYREKLWEMHKPGATPRDVQCCLRTMAQLRKRIETLEKCTEKLKNDRESVEDSFRYHSKQQEHMTMDLLEKMRELQAVRTSTTDSGARQSTPVPLNASIIERLHDLSGVLVKQTQELEAALSSKTRQICQLRWELLHRDLSTAKMETELHAHTAHRKRSKYAHFRSHSSEEAPSLVQNASSKTDLTSDIYYTAITPEDDFKAIQLTNTIQELSRELLRLSAGADHSVDVGSDRSALSPVSNNENSRVKSCLPKIKEKTKTIVVRRSSADNISLVSTNDETRMQDSSSTDSENSSDDEGYTRIAWRPATRVTYPEAERLLMSYGEQHPPRTQRKKKIQKVSRCNSSPGRRRTNTWQANTNSEKPGAPQKCHSFRVMREGLFEELQRKDHISDSNLNSESLQQAVREIAKTMEFYHKQQKKDVCRVDSLVKENHRWLREVASDSKIPSVVGMGHTCGKQPIRSLSEKHKTNGPNEGHQQFQNKRCKKRATDYNNKVRTDSPRSWLKVSAKTDADKNVSFISAEGKFPNSTTNEAHQNSAQELPSSAEVTTINIPFPRRKSSSPAVETVKEQSFTFVFPKKRSLSSEKDTSMSESSGKDISNLHPETEDSLDTDVNENYLLKSATDPRFFNDFESSKTLKTEERFQTDTAQYGKPKTQDISCENGQENVSGDHPVRKRKASDRDSMHLELSQGVFRSTMKSEMSCQTNDSVDQKNNWSPGLDSGYIKSPSAPSLDWRKTCAKKVSREGAPNVRTLIEKYNRAAESQASSPFSSNVSSPVSARKISSPTYSSKRELFVQRQVYSTPNTPSVVMASAFYNPITFKPVNLDLLPKSPPPSPMSIARSEALRKAKEEFISSDNTKHHTTLQIPFQRQGNWTSYTEKNAHSSESGLIKSKSEGQKRLEDDRLSNTSMDSMSLVVYRTGESCKESRLAKRSVEHPKADSHAGEENCLKTSKSLSSSSIFKTVLHSDFKMPATLLRLKRSKRKKDMTTVSHLCRQSLLLSTDDAEVTAAPVSHKSCPSSPELKSKNVAKPNWFHRNILRHK